MITQQISFRERDNTGNIKQNMLLPYLKTVFIVFAIPARSNPTVSPFHAKEVGEKRGNGGLQSDRQASIDIKDRHLDRSIPASNRHLHL